MKKALSIIFLSVGCSDNIEIQKFPNPFNEAFQGSNMKLLVSTDDFGYEFNDSLFFDRKGRLIKEKRGWATGRYQYDSNNYVIREYFKSDAIENYFNKLEFRNNCIYEYQSPINTWNWEYVASDMDSLRKKSNRKPDWAYDTTIYVLSNGFVESKIYNGKYLEKFIYSKTNKLISREHISNRYKTEYHYNNDKLKEIIYYEKDNVVWRKYFSSGLLDSTIYPNGIDRIYSERHYWE